MDAANARWNQKCTFQVESQQDALMVEVWDHTKKSCLGRCICPLYVLTIGKEALQTYALEGNSQGELQLGLTLKEIAMTTQEEAATPVASCIRTS